MYTNLANSIIDSVLLTKQIPFDDLELLITAALFSAVADLLVFYECT